MVLKLKTILVLKFNTMKLVVLKIKTIFGFKI